MRRAERDAAFTEFVAARQGHLRRVAYGICRDRHQAEDLLQTALTKLYLAWPRLRHEGREEAYVRQILVRSHIDTTRRASSREVVGVDDHERAAREPVPYDERSALLDALHSLPEQQRKVVVLRHWLGLSVRETAHEIGLSEGTVKSHSHRGLAALQAALAGVDAATE